MTATTRLRPGGVPRASRSAIGSILVVVAAMISSSCGQSREPAQDVRPNPPEPREDVRTEPAESRDAARADDPDSFDVQAGVASRGRVVMPFDLDRTTHVFAPGSRGGVQTVTADVPGDSAQVRAIREHLQTEAARFKRGDFSDPAFVHGDAMPGLQDLRRGYDRIDVRYDSLPDGGRITYTTSEPALVSAVHAWFRAQVSDHGPHARF